MTRSQPQKTLCKIEIPARGPGLQRIARFTGTVLDSILGLDQLNKLYSECSEGSPDYKEFLHRILKWLHVRWRPTQADLAAIPRKGPLIVVANHPFGALEGLVLGGVLSTVRNDVKITANFLLGRITELRDLFIFVDPFAKEDSTKANVAPLRESLRHLKNGGVLAFFPAGEVANMDLRRMEIVDPAWSMTVARIIQRARCPVLPVFFEGRNSWLFQGLGLVHPRLRTGMLAREVFNKKGVQIKYRIGSVIPFKRLENLKSDEELTSYLRQRTYLLRHRTTPRGEGPAQAPASLPRQQPVIDAVSPHLLATEIGALPPNQLLVDADECHVYHARAQQIPYCLRELGRLRELTFRATGEGTGKSCDIDRFDEDYVHLFVWEKNKKEIVGAYRLGPSDEILESKGKSGLYTSTLFKCKTALLRQITPALELGQSFVRAEYQKSFSPLLLLWKGIGQYVKQNLRYRYLFGPVSISNTYQSVSKQLMVSFLKAHHCPPALMEMVQARNPFRAMRIAGWDSSAVQLFRDSEDVSDLVCDLEPESKGIPVLLRQYLKLGAKLLAFNVDPDFGDCVDALMVCDMTKTDVRMLDRYMGKEGRAQFLQYHADRSRPAERMRTIAG